MKRHRLLGLLFALPLGCAPGVEERQATSEEGVVQGAPGAGPIAEWEDVNTFVVSADDVEEGDDDLAALLEGHGFRVLRAGHGACKDADGLCGVPVQTSSWPRDWAPLVSRRVTFEDGIQKPKWVGFAYEGRAFADNAPAARRWLAEHFHASLIETNAPLDGGNFATDGEGRCFVAAPGAAALGAGVEEALRDQVGCRSVHVLPALPAKVGAVGHVDETVKFLPGRRAIVASAPEAVLEAPLDATARTLVSLGFEVTRLALPEAQCGRSDPREDDATCEVFKSSFVMSYANAVLAVGPGRRVAFVPVFEAVYTKYIDRLGADAKEAMLDRAAKVAPLDRAALAAYRRLLDGWSVIPVSAPLKAMKNGSLHCMTWSFRAPRDACTPDCPRD